MKIITILSDFGTNSGYPGQMKGVILSLTNCSIVDITHEITPYNVREGAFVLRNTVSKFPVGTVHVAVVARAAGRRVRQALSRGLHQVLEWSLLTIRDCSAKAPNQSCAWCPKRAAGSR